MKRNDKLEIFKTNDQFHKLFHFVTYFDKKYIIYYSFVVFIENNLNSTIQEQLSIKKNLLSFKTKQFQQSILHCNFIKGF